MNVSFIDLRYNRFLKFEVKFMRTDVQILNSINMLFVWIDVA